MMIAQGPNMQKLIFLFSTLFCLVQCAHSNNPEKDELFVLDGKKYFISDLSQENQYKAFQAESSRYKALVDIIGNELIEIASQKDPQIKKQMEQSDFEVTEAELKLYYEKNKEKIPYPYNSVKRELKKMYVKDKLEDRKVAYLKELSNRRGVKLAIQAPVSPSYDINVAKYPKKGGGRIEIIEFADFTCPICRSVRKELDQLIAANPGKINLVHRYYFKKNSYMGKRLAFMGHCAHQKNKFWEFHEHVFDNQASYKDLRQDKVAEKLGLEKDEFEKCVSDSSTKKFVTNSVKEADKFRVSGNPTFYADGKFVSTGENIDKLKAYLRNL